MEQNNNGFAKQKKMYRGIRKDDPKQIDFHFEVENDDNPIFDTLSEFFEVWPIEDGRRYFMGTRISDKVQHIFIAEGGTDPKYLLYDPASIHEIMDQYELDQYEDWDFEDE